MIELILPDLAAKRIAMNSKNFCRSALIPIRAFQHPLDEFLLKFRDGFFEQNTALYHQPHKRFQLIFHTARSEGDAPQFLFASRTILLAGNDPLTRFTS
jgi:hypothetical protein